jgi:deoxyribonuclease-4
MKNIGCHVSIAGGIFNAPKRAADLGCEVFQLFTRSPRGGPAPALTSEVVAQFKSEMKTNKQKEVYIHTPYYINFAASTKPIREASIRIVREELERGTLIGAKYSMTHLGSSGDSDRKECLDMVAQAVDHILDGYKGTTELLLEISAGAGSVMGCTFEELAYIMDKSSTPAGICLDTAHMFATGYDIKTKEGFKKTIKLISDTVGKKSIKLIHANDSKIELGGKRDRHDHIGYGKIGKEGFENMMAEFNLDFILETEHDKVKEDIDTLKTIRDNI